MAMNLQSRPKDEFTTSLRRGSSLLKFGRTGSPHFTFFRMSEDESELLWRTDGLGYGRKMRAVQLGSVTSLVRGQTTATFKKSPRPSIVHLSFSLIYVKRDKERTLDLVCKTEQELELWFTGLQAFIEFQVELRRQQDEGQLTEPLGSVSNFLPQVGTPNSNPDSESESVAEEGISKSFLGDLYVWGAHEAGRACPVDGWQEGSSPSLVNDSARLDVRQASISRCHAALVTRQGNVYTWGRGAGGQLGHGSTQDCTQPRLVEELVEQDILVKQVECSENITIALTQAGAVYSWGGGNKSGILGHGKRIDKQWTPRRIDFGLSTSVCITTVSTGPFHCAALSSNGGLYTWGDGFEGRLGHGSTESRHVPAFVEYFNEMRVISVSCGVFHTAAVARPLCETSKPTEQQPSEDSIATAPFAKRRTLPDVPRDLNWGPLAGRKPTKSPGQGKGQFRFCSAAAVGTLTPSGSGFGDDVGIPSGESSPAATAVGDPRLRGKVFTWGGCDNGCLGRGEGDKDELLPGEVGGTLSGLDATQVSCGYHMTATMTSCGRVFQWGNIPGDNFAPAASWTNSKIPVQVRGELDAWKVEQVVCGNHHCLARATSHTQGQSALFAWGRGQEGQLGSGSPVDSGMPTKVKALRGADIVSVVAGAGHTLAIAKNDPLVTEAAAMKDAERLAPFLLGATKAIDMKNSLRIEIPNAYTTGGPASALATTGARMPFDPKPPMPAEAGAIVPHRPPPSPLQASTRQNSSSMTGIAKKLIQTALASQMAKKKGKARVGLAPFMASTLYRQGSTGSSAASPSRFHQQPSPEHAVPGNASRPGSFASMSEAVAAEAGEDSDDEYVSQLEKKVQVLSNRVCILEEQLERRSRHEHRAVRRSLSLKDEDAQRAVAPRALRNAELATSVDSGPTFSDAGTTPGPLTNRTMMPVTPHTGASFGPGAAASPMTDNDSGANSGSVMCHPKEGGASQQATAHQRYPPGEMSEGPSSSTGDPAAAHAGDTTPGNGATVTSATPASGEADLLDASAPPNKQPVTPDAGSISLAASTITANGDSSCSKPMESIEEEPPLPRSELDPNSHTGPCTEATSALTEETGASCEDGPQLPTAAGALNSERFTALQDENDSLKKQVQFLQGRLQLQARLGRMDSFPAANRPAAETSSSSAVNGTVAPIRSQEQQLLRTPSATRTILKPGEWIEMVHPGVYLTLAAAPSGKAELRKVRFSSKQFSKQEAEGWWQDNRVRIAERFFLVSPTASPGRGHRHSASSPPPYLPTAAAGARMSSTMSDELPMAQLNGYGQSLAEATPALPAAPPFAEDFSSTHGACPPSAVAPLLAPVGQLGTPSAVVHAEYMNGHTMAHAGGKRLEF